MRAFAFIFMFCVTLGASAAPEKISEWRVETLGYESFASHVAFPTLRLPLLRQGAGGGELISWEKAPHNAGLRLLRYEAGEIGTSERVKVVRGLIVDPSKSRILADEVLAYLDAEPPHLALGPQPKWSWSSGVLLIQHTDRRTPLRVKLH